MKGFDGNAETMALLAYRLECLSRKAYDLAVEYERNKLSGSEPLRGIMDKMREIADEIHSNYF